jgi:hypothetical protein
MLNHALNAVCMRAQTYHNYASGHLLIGDTLSSNPIVANPSHSKPLSPTTPHPWRASSRDGDGRQDALRRRFSIPPTSRCAFW